MIPISPVGQRVFPSNTAQCWKCLPVVPVEIWGWSYPTVSLRPWLLLPSLSRRSPRKGLFEGAFDIYLLELLEKPLYLVSLSGFARNIILDYIVYLYMSIIAIPPILDFPRWFRFKIFEKRSCKFVSALWWKWMEVRYAWAVMVTFIPVFSMISLNLVCSDLSHPMLKPEEWCLWFLEVPIIYRFVSHSITPVVIPSYPFT